MKTCELLKIVLKIMEIDDIYKDQIDAHKQDFTECRKHLIKSWWHDTNEEPRLNQWFLAQIGDNAFDTFVMEMDKNEDWKEWSNGVNIKRWAYIRDLLPREG